MVITYRKFENPADLDLQRDLWLEATKKLPWAWKPNNTQKWFSQQSNFDASSKLFAQDGNKPVGYISCIRRENFTPMGFPWVLEGYEGEIQDHLFDTVYSYAISTFKSKSFLQRFRKEWKYQIRFFERKGFNLDWANPIYVLDLQNKGKIDINSRNEISIFKRVPNEDFQIIAQNDSWLKTEDFMSLITYFNEDIDLDWVLLLKKGSIPVAISAVTIRADTGYAELNLLAENSEFPGEIDIALEITVNEMISRQVNWLSVTLEQNSPKIDFYESYDFKLKSESVFYSKELE
ncbi:MAG: hypothetical protein ACFFD4_30960 [Candidatus Odinarchaeota archaeon]